MRSEFEFWYPFDLRVSGEKGRMVFPRGFPLLFLGVFEGFFGFCERPRVLCVPWSPL
jgi:hypothetical protein